MRKNYEGKLFSLAYGQPYAINVDPIEKKPLFHFLPGSRILSIGTAGCNLACKFCQNWNISKAKFNQEKSSDLPPERVVQLAMQYKSSSIAYTYNEPTIFAEYAMETAAQAANHNLKNVMVTNGYISSEAIDEVYQNINAANVDIKSFSEVFYQKLTLSHLMPVLESIKHLKKMGIWIEITNLIIPTWNDDLREIGRLCEWIRDELDPFVPLHFTAFHPDYKLSDLPATSPEMLLKARQRALEIGLKYVYVGNVANEKASSTYCHNCGALLIKRNWHSISMVNMLSGKCLQCGQVIPGVFK